MKYFVAVLLAVLLVLSACGSQPSSPDALSPDEAPDAAASSSPSEPASPSAPSSSEAVNFKCVLPTGQTVYFLKDKAKVENQDRVSWLSDDSFLAVLSAGDKEYLVSYPVENADMSFEDMMNIYAMSKQLPDYECTLGVVTEADVSPPSDLPVVSAEEFQQILFEQMQKEMGG